MVGGGDSVMPGSDFRVRDEYEMGEREGREILERISESKETAAEKKYRKERVAAFRNSSKRRLRCR